TQIGWACLPLRVAGTGDGLAARTPAARPRRIVCRQGQVRGSTPERYTVSTRLRGSSSHTILAPNSGQSATFSLTLRLVSLCERVSRTRSGTTGIYVSGN